MLRNSHFESDVCRLPFAVYVKPKLFTDFKVQFLPRDREFSLQLHHMYTKLGSFMSGSSIRVKWCYHSNEASSTVLLHGTARCFAFHKMKLKIFFSNFHISHC